MSAQPQYAGRLHGRLSTPGLELAETSYRRGQRIGAHAHEHPLLVIVVSGEMTERVGGRSVRCPSGTALYHPAGESHSHCFEAPGSRCLVGEFDAAWLDRLEAGSRVLPCGPVARREPAVTGAGRLLHAEFRRLGGAVPGAVDGLVLALLASLAGRSDPVPERGPAFLGRVLERLDDDPGTRFELAELARLAGVTPEHLARSFRRHQGCTLGEYVRRARVERARRALVEGDRPLAEIALELGFFDQSHFTRTFKAHVGCTPGAYRAARVGAPLEPPAGRSHP